MGSVLVVPGLLHEFSVHHAVFVHRRLHDGELTQSVYKKQKVNSLDNMFLSD